MVWIVIQTLSARNERLSCSPRSAKVRMVLAPQGVLEHVVVQPERGLQSAGVLHQQTPRLVGLEEPLVRVQPDGIGAFHSA